jgi:hypothetical protein
MRGNLTLVKPNFPSRNGPAQSEVVLRHDCRYLINPGSVGQPRDGDWRAAYATFDDDKAMVTWYRVPYKVLTAQGRILPDNPRNFTSVARQKFCRTIQIWRQRACARELFYVIEVATRAPFVDAPPVKKIGCGTCGNDNASSLHWSCFPSQAFGHEFRVWRLKCVTQSANDTAIRCVRARACPKVPRVQT